MKNEFDFLMRVFVAALVTIEIVRWSAESLASASIVQVFAFVGGILISLIVSLELIRIWCDDVDKKRRQKRHRRKPKSRPELKNYELTK